MRHLWPAPGNYLEGFFLYWNGKKLSFSWIGQRVWVDWVGILWLKQIEDNQLLTLILKYHHTFWLIPFPLVVEWRTLLCTPCGMLWGLNNLSNDFVVAHQQIYLNKQQATAITQLWLNINDFIWISPLHHAIWYVIQLLFNLLTSVWSIVWLCSYVRPLLQIRGMHTLIRDREISKHDFVFYSDRLIRLVLSAAWLSWSSLIDMSSVPCLITHNVTA